jgi:L-amino acid N-acyltransferase YncA
MTGDPKRRTIRDGSEADGGACAAIYEPYVTGTAVTFETEPPRTGQMAQRIAGALATHAWVVLEEDGRVCGYAYGARFKDRAAYRWSCEVSVYVELGRRRRTGAGRELYAALFERLAARGFRIAVAGTTLPNEASVGFHRAMGFEPAGTFRNIGYKFDAWHDVFWMQRPLATGKGPPPELI